MHRIHGATLALLFAASIAHASPLPPAGPLAPAVPAPRPGRVLVALRPGATLATAPDGAARAGSATLTATLGRLALTRATRLDRAAAARGDAGAPAFVALASSDPGFDPYAAARALRTDPDVLAAAPDVALRLHLTPNDPWYSLQWHLGTSAAAVRAPQGWDQSTGNAGVVIAILDSGVDLTHSDLAYKIWRNTGEIALNGLDDDGNGYEDDVNGYDFGDIDADPNPEPIFDAVNGVDVGWHGTFVAGLAAASTNNGTGVAGLAWNCRVMPLKVTDVDGTIWLDAIVAGFDYAAAKGAKVLNLSMGATDPAAAEFFQLLVDGATAAGVVVVASAGNDGTDTPNYPAACDDVLAVAATNSGNNRASFSCWGPWVDLAAPGEAVWSCIARNYTYDAYSLAVYQAYFGFDGAHAYMRNDGTSFSAPLVSGAAALVRSRFPHLTARQVSQQLVVDGDARAYDNPIGPRLNVEKALTFPLDAPAQAPPAALAFAAPAPNPASGPVRFAFALPRAATVALRVLDAQGRLVRTLADGARGAGAHALAWDGRDASGRPVAAGLYFADLRAGGERATRRIAIVR